VKLLCVAGSRGERARLAPVVQCLEGEHDIVCAYVSCAGEVPTWDLTAPPPPDWGLEIEDPTPASRVGSVLRWSESLLAEGRFDLLLTCGESDMAVGAAIAACLAEVTIAHLDAGVMLDPANPNARLLDQAAAFLLAPHLEAVQRLAARGMEDAAYLCGDTLADSPPVAGVASGAADGCLCYLAGVAVGPAVLPAVLAALRRLPMAVTMPAGPRAQALLAAAGLPRGNLAVVEPLDYAPLQEAVARAALVITDSATLQREAYFRGTVAIGLAPADFPDGERTGWVRPVAVDEDAIIAAAQAPPPPHPPEIEGQRGAALRAAQFLTAS